MDLGVTFDNNFNFRQHISQTCQCCFYHFRNLRRIRRYMSFAVAKTIATALVSSRFDYCNSLYYNVAPKDILKLQHIKNVQHVQNWWYKYVAFLKKEVCFCNWYVSSMELQLICIKWAYKLLMFFYFIPDIHCFHKQLSTL